MRSPHYHTRPLLKITRMLSANTLRKAHSFIWLRTSLPMSNQMPDVEVVLPAKDQNQAMSVCSCKQHTQWAIHVKTLMLIHMLSM
jgi:hypothetical protein